MKDDRLKQIERHVCEEVSFGCFGCMGLNECITEIRRRGKMVDRLLEGDPIAGDDLSIWCVHCDWSGGHGDTVVHDDDCPYRCAEQARDWEPDVAMARVEGG